MGKYLLQGTSAKIVEIVESMGLYVVSFDWSDVTVHVRSEEEDAFLDACDIPDVTWFYLGEVGEEL